MVRKKGVNSLRLVKILKLKFVKLSKINKKEKNEFSGYHIHSTKLLERAGMPNPSAL